MILIKSIKDAAYCYLHTSHSSVYVFIRLVWWQTTEWQCAIVFDVMSTHFRNIVRLFIDIIYIKMVSKRQHSKLTFLIQLFDVVPLFFQHIEIIHFQYCNAGYWLGHSMPQFYATPNMLCIGFRTIYSAVHVNAVFKTLNISETMNNLYACKLYKCEYFVDNDF